jgi:hypothetical protein
MSKLIEYIAVYHWEGHSPEAPVKIEAETWDEAEAILIAEAIKLTEHYGSHLDCDEETTPEQYIEDYFHIDNIVPMRNISSVSRITGGY